MKNIKLCAVAAMARNGVIGRDGKIPWHISEDFKHFKRVTMGKPMIMGRKTWDSLGRKPLPGRAHIVVSRGDPSGEGATFVKTIDEALQAARAIAIKDGVDEIAVIGGGEIYRQTLPQTDVLYLTRIERDYEGDASFPEFDAGDWRAVSEDRHEGDPAYTFVTLERVKKD